MAGYVLKRTWHTEVFHRTITIGGKTTRLAFHKREPLDLSKDQLAAIQAAGGAPIEPAKEPKVPAASAISKPGKPKKGS